MQGATGRPRPDDLKVSIGYRDGFVGEGQISYAGPNALARGRLALDVVKERIQDIPTRRCTFDIIGVDAVHRGAGMATAREPDEVRIRVAATTASRKDAGRVAHEVAALWLNGPAGGGGAFRTTYEVVAIASVFVPRAAVSLAVNFVEV